MRPSRLPAALALAAAFLLILGALGAWLIHAYVASAPAVILSTPVADLPHPPVTRPSTAPIAGNRIFRGAVTDAATHLPIPDFQVRLGFQGRRPLSFYEPAESFHNGQYSIKTSYNGANAIWRLRIEAPGHLPAFSPLLRDSQTADFALQSGNDVRGQVHDPSGHPVAGASVFLALADTPVEFELTNKSVGYRGIETTTAPDGAFSFTPQTAPFELAVVANAGYAQIDSAALASNSTIQLSPWGHIDGRLTLNGKPAPKTEILWGPWQSPEASAPALYINDYAMTSADGRFHFDRVPPQPLGIQRMVMVRPLAIRTVTFAQQVRQVIVPAGQTVTVNLGDNGRPVTGRLAIPKSLPLGNYPLIIGSALSTGVPDTQPTETNYFQYWQHRYAIEIDTAGRFTINDVIPGSYVIKIQFVTIPGDHLFASGTAKFTMPPITPDNQDQPLQIPDIHIAKVP